MPATQYVPERKRPGIFESMLRGAMSQNVGPRVNLGGILGGLLTSNRDAMANADYEQAMQSQMRSQAAGEMMKLMPAQTAQGIAQANLGEETARSGIRQIPSAEEANIAQHVLSKGQSEMGARLLSPLEELTRSGYSLGMAQNKLGREQAASNMRILPSAETATISANKAQEGRARGETEARTAFSNAGMMLPFGDQKFRAVSPEMVPMMEQGLRFSMIEPEFQMRKDVVGSQLANEVLGREATQQGMDIRGRQDQFQSTPVDIPGFGVMNPQMFEVMSQAQQIKDMADFRRDANMGQMFQSLMGALTPDMQQAGIAMLKGRYPEVARYMPTAPVGGATPAGVRTGVQAVQDALAAKNAKPSAVQAPTPQAPGNTPTPAPTSNSESSIQKSMNNPIQFMDIFKQKGTNVPANPNRNPIIPPTLEFPLPTDYPPFDPNAKPAPMYQGPRLEKPTTMNDNVQEFLSPMPQMMTTADVLAMIRQLMGGQV